MIASIEEVTSEKASLQKVVHEMELQKQELMQDLETEREAREKAEKGKLELFEVWHVFAFSIEFYSENNYFIILIHSES